MIEVEDGTEVQRLRERVAELEDVASEKDGEIASLWADLKKAKRERDGFEDDALSLEHAIALRDAADAEGVAEIREKVADFFRGLVSAEELAETAGLPRAFV